MSRSGASNTRDELDGANPEEVLREVEHPCHGYRLGKLGLSSLQNAPGRPSSLAVPKGTAGEGLLARAGSDRRRGNSLQLEKCRFRHDTRKKLLPVRVARLWKKLSREALDTPSLEVLRARLNGAMNHRV